MAMTTDQIRREITHILEFEPKETQVEKLLDLVSRVARDSSNDAYHEALIDRCGTIACSWDD